MLCFIYLTYFGRLYWSHARKCKTPPEYITCDGHYFHCTMHHSNWMNSCPIPKMFIMDAFPNTHLIKNNVIHAICFSWSWILRNVDYGETLLWFVRCVWWKDKRGMGSCRGIFPSAQPQSSQPVYLQQVSPPFFHSFTLTYLAMCFECRLYQCPCLFTSMHALYALGSHNVYDQISTRFPGFQAKPSPHSATPDTWVPAHFELI